MRDSRGFSQGGGRAPTSVGIVAGHPTQWESPFFGVLAQSSELRPHVFYGSRFGLEEGVEADSGLRIKFDMPGMLEGYDHSFLLNGSQESAFAAVAEGLALQAIIVEGHVGHLHSAAMRWATRNHVPLIYRSDSTLLYPEPRWKRIAKAMQRPRFLKRFSAFLPLSSPAADYLLNYGVLKQRIFLSPYMVHNVWYKDQTESHRLDRPGLMNTLGLARFRRVVLAILRLEPRENPIEFLEAAHLLQGSHPDVAFVLVGDGPLRAQVLAFIAARQLSNVVTTDFLPITTLPRYYAVSDVFVHSAREECWGLSVNEAMASGVPVVVSTGVGSRFDLIPSEECGLVYPAGQPAALARAVSSLLENPERAQRIRLAANMRIAAFGYSTAVAAFERAVSFAVQRRRGEEDSR